MNFRSSSSHIKSLLNLLPFPVTATLAQVFAVMIYVVIYSQFTEESIEFPSQALLFKMVPLGLVQLSTKLLHQVALSYVSVSFVHTVKVLTPLFTVVLSRIVLGEKTTRLMIYSLVPIVGGVLLCTVTESHWSTAGYVRSVAAIILNQVFYLLLRVLLR